MNEHRGIDGGIFRDGGMDQVIGNQTVLVEYEFWRDGRAEKHFEIYPNIRPNGQKGDEGEIAGRDIVAQGNHGLFRHIDGDGWIHCDKIQGVSKNLTWTMNQSRKLRGWRLQRPKNSNY